MEFFDAIKNRRSIRSYRKQDLTQDLISKLVAAARMAPSAGNAQPWAFIIAKENRTKQALAQAAYNQRWLEAASVVFVVCADMKRAEESYGERGKTLYALQDTSAAIENILLTATSLGLGGCWMGAFREEEVGKIIKAPPHMRPVALIPIGYPNESPPPRSRRPHSEVVLIESF
ncbi:MAG: nitroreductase family protein [Crenarchaeota archaeon]|jgi:nitroreductase|nr:nitroreductase family protein [Thermoproteota archaeon]